MDSAVAAYLLKEQWYEVVAGFMKNYVDEENPHCSTYQDAKEAIRVANFLWIEIISFDLRQEYEDKIIKYIYDGYQRWITPNPDILCNSLIKFDVFLDKALELGFDWIAMGHYARILPPYAIKQKSLDTINDPLNPPQRGTLKYENVNEQKKCEKYLDTTNELLNHSQRWTLNNSYISTKKKYDNWQIELIWNDIKKRWLIRDGIHLPYNPNNVDIAKRFRKQMTPAEQKLRDKYLSKNKYKFYRQRPIDHFIVDFYCSKFDLVIEVDGWIHYKQKEYDQMRTEFLNLYWLNVLRFSNKEVLENFDNVCKKIEKYISEYLVSSKKLSPTRGDTALAGEGLKQRTGGIVNLINFIDEGGSDINYKLLRGVDYNKDQSYFLSGLNQYQLRKTLFPIGGMKKEEVRELATKIWLPNADRKDSQWLCFIWKVPMKEFLKKRLPTKKWDIVLLDGTKVWEHEWAYFFTIGQSRGLDINKKAYVVKIDVKKI